jgi:hypothetical protein
MTKTKTVRKRFDVALADLPNMVDALFVGSYDKPGGWVTIAVNDKGRGCKAMA